MSISEQQTKIITRLIEDFINSATPDPNKLRELVAKKNVLPLCCDFGGVAAMNSNGEIISFAWDDWEELRVETDPRIRNVALFQSSKKYPELKELIVKPDTASLCPSCGGAGINPYAEKLNTDAIVCYCGGLGWIP